MKTSSKLNWTATFLLGVLIALSVGVTPASAYVGPGPGIGLLGSLIAVVAVVLIGVLGLVIYPIRQMKKKKRQQQMEANQQSQTDEAKGGTNVG